MVAVASHKLVELIFQRAFDAPGDIRINCGSHGAAINTRQKLNNWRVKDRRDSVTIYPINHPLHGASIYDNLTMRVPPPEAPDSHYIYISKRAALNFEIEDITPARPSPIRIEEIPDLNIEGDDTK